MSKIVLPQDYNKASGHRDITQPPSFDVPITQEHDHFDLPFQIGEIRDKDSFDQRGFGERHYVTTVKRPGELKCTLPTSTKNTVGLEQFEELVQTAIDLEYRKSPLYPFKRAKLITRAFNGDKFHPAQPLHFDPDGKPPSEFVADGRLYGLYSAINNLGTSYASKDNPESEDIQSTSNYGIYYSTQRCLHGQPDIPIGTTRVFAGVAFYLSNDELIEIEQEHGIKPRSFEP